LRPRAFSNEDILPAMRAFPRHEFVQAEHLKPAYDNHRLPIEYSQTISLP